MSASECPVCDSPATLRCTGCNDLHYCSKDCQKSHWPSHKGLCKSFMDFRTRPAQNLCRAILFPASGKKPKFMWLPILTDPPIQPTPPYNIGIHQALNCGPYPAEVIKTNVETGRPLKHQIRLCYDDHFVEKYSDLNSVVVEITAGEVGYGWRGPLLACCSDRVIMSDGSERIAVQDMDMELYSALVTYFKWYDGTYSKSTYKGYATRTSEKVQCVKARCAGEIHDNGSPAREVVEESASGPLFNGDADVSVISKCIGLPLMAIKAPDSSRSGLGSCNQASFFFLGVDPNLKSPLNDVVDGAARVALSGMDSVLLQVQLYDKY